MNAETGLPIIKDPEAASKKQCMVAPVFYIIPRLVGTLIALAIYLPNKTTYDKRIVSINKLVDPGLELGYLYLAAGVFCFLGWVLNTLPTVFKSKVMPNNAGNLRSNMLIYKVNTTTGKTPYVVMEEDGHVGEYNRANRALFHFTENVIPLLPCILLSGLILSKAVLVLVSVYAAARIWYQLAYTIGGYGVACCKHAIPFSVHTMIVASTLEALTWVLGVRMLMLS